LNFTSKISFFIALLVFTACRYSVKHAEWIAHGMVHKMDYRGDTVSKKFAGDVKVYYPTGAIECIFKVKDGYLNEYERHYYKNGTLKSEYYYIDGIQEGVEKHFFENGKLQEETSYTNGNSNGFDVVNYPNGRMARYMLVIDSGSIYTINFDTNGMLKGNPIWGYDLKAPASIHLGEKFHAEFRLPLIKGMDTITDFNIGVFSQNTIGIDSLNNYHFIASFKNKGWIYSLNKNTQKTDNNLNNSIEVVNIPINKNGSGIFEYAPIAAGNYLLMACITRLINKRDSLFECRNLKIKFTVTQ
jgi:hypothetical protein